MGKSRRGAEGVTQASGCEDDSGRIFCEDWTFAYIRPGAAGLEADVFQVFLVGVVVLAPVGLAVDGAEGEGVAVAAFQFGEHAFVVEGEDVGAFARIGLHFGGGLGFGIADEGGGVPVGGDVAVTLDGHPAVERDLDALAGFDHRAGKAAGPQNQGVFGKAVFGVGDPGVGVGFGFKVAVADLTDAVGVVVGRNTAWCQAWPHHSWLL